MKFWILTFAVFGICASTFGADLTATPSSLAFGTLNQGQGKTMTFILKNTTGHKMRAELFADAPFTVSPAAPTLQEAQQITISVALPSTVAAGTLNKKVTIKGSRLGLIPRDQGQVALSASIVTQPDFQIVAIDHGNGVNSLGRTVSVHLRCTVLGLGPTPMKTQVFVTLDDGPELKMMDLQFVYVSTGQINAYGQTIPTSVKTMKVRAVTEPDNSVVESNENNNQSILILNY